MAQNVTLYKLLISCPSDVKDELSIIESAVEEFNELYAEPLGITIQAKHWSKSSYAQSGGKPQALLNEQFVDKCDAAVAIFWTKFGTPTDEYGSGTEEEIERFIQTKKQIFMYFSDKPLSPSKMNEDGYKEVQTFREKYKDRGLYFTYDSNENFKKMFFAHLSKYFLTEQKVKEIKNERISELKLMGIDKIGKLTEDASVYPFELNAETTMKQFLDKIKALYKEISEMNVGKRIASNNIFASFTSPVDIDDEEQKYITEVANQLKVHISEDFFDLGNLGKDSLAINMYCGPQLKGTSEEIKKYRKIKELHETISKALDWAPVENGFSDKRCLRLAIQNCGKAVDEDVEITFVIPQKSLLTLSEFPRFKNDEMGYLLNDCDMSILFGIDSTAEYVNYSESERNRNTSYTHRPYGLPGYIPNYSDDFIDELNDIFCYSIYSENDNYIVKLKVDYIKHNTTVAFPSILFVKDNLAEIPYKITSKNNPNIIEGTLKVICSNS